MSKIMTGSWTALVKKNLETPELSGMALENSHNSCWRQERNDTSEHSEKRENNVVNKAVLSIICWMSWKGVMILAPHPAWMLSHMRQAWTVCKTAQDTWHSIFDARAWCMKCCCKICFMTCHSNHNTASSELRQLIACGCFCKHLLLLRGLWFGMKL